MNISFEEARALEVDFKASSATEGDNMVSIAFSEKYDEECPHSFSVIFDIELKSEKKFALHVEVETCFRTDAPITEEFKASPFPKVNAPAIGYPYVRSMISMLTMIAGTDSAVIQTINFQALYNESLEAEN